MAFRNLDSPGLTAERALLSQELGGRNGANGWSEKNFSFGKSGFFRAGTNCVDSCKESGCLSITPRLFDSCLCVAVGNISAPRLGVGGGGGEVVVPHYSRRAEQRRWTRKSEQYEALTQASAD